MLSRIWDGFSNVVANLGTGRDKAAASAYALTIIDRTQLLVQYRSSWLHQAIVDIPALDCVRKWRAWQATPDQISAIEAEEKRLDLRERVQEAMTAARLFGGAALYIGTGDADPAKPLTADRMGNGGIRSLTVLTPSQLTPDSISRDINGGFYGKPEFYTLSTERAGMVRIHASRLVVFCGVAQPDIALASDGWGDSVLMAADDAIKQADSTSANVASLVFEAKVDVFRLKGFANALAENTDATDQAISRRLSGMATIKGINGAVVLDGDDEYTQKNASFGTLPDLMDRFMLNVAGAARIPVTRLFGRSAVGLSGSGDGDERVYFDRIQAIQELEMQPAMAVLDECLIRSALGQRDPAVWYSWKPLRQISEKERADIFAQTATAARALAGTGGTSPALLPIEALSDALVNELVEQGVMPGLEAAIEEYGALSGQDDGADDEAGIGGSPVAAPENTSGPLVSPVA